MPEPQPVPHQPDADQLRQLRDLYDTTRYFDAFQACQAFAPVSQWDRPDALLLAGRLVSHWGDAALSNRLHLKAWRLAPQLDEALYWFALTTSHKHGSFEALRVLRDHAQRLPAEPTTPEQAHLLLLEARLRSHFRDFTTAEAIVGRVELAFSEDPWLWVEKASLLREQDRYDEALAALRTASRLRPWYRPAVQGEAHLLQLLGRDEEACALLEDAWPRGQSPSTGQNLVHLYEEQSRHADILRALERIVALLPMPDASEHRWIAARRCDAAYGLGDLDTARTAAEQAAAAGSGYHRELAPHYITKPGADRRVRLAVGFVRQHHQTCAPATLAALSNFWGRSISHTAIAEAICYDGTPDHVERTWVERQGWIAREFRVTWEIACALLDRGCPFSLVTVDIGSAHMQAVIGYDARLGTLLIRDPYLRNYTEWIAGNFFSSNEINGPRGLLVLPPAEAHRLDGLTLPDEPLYDAWHQVRVHLAAHRRADAEAAFAHLSSQAPEHILTLRAGRELALYDNHDGRCLDFTRQVRARFPSDVNWQLEELRLLDLVGSSVERRARLQELGGRRAGYLTLRRQYAEDLMRDARTTPLAGRILRSGLRRQSRDSAHLRAYGNWLWAAHRFDEATFVYRLAACAAEKIESYWNTFFGASRHVQQTEESLALLTQRFRRWSDLSSYPVRTLFQSLDALDRTAEGFARLEEARRARPDDGELLLFIADARSRYGNFALAADLLAAAESRAPRTAWLASAARLAGRRQDHTQALALWQELLALNPLDHDVQTAVVGLLHTCQGRPAALAHLAAACDAQPHRLPLLQLHVEWLRSEPPALALAAVDRLLALDPAHAWGLREKALILRRLHQPEAALASAEEALRIAPHAPHSHGIKGDMLLALGRTAEARACYEAGIRLNIDAHWLFDSLIDASPDFAARRAAVEFVQRELQQQVSVDNACLHFRACARPILTPAELHLALETLWRAQPDTWAVWSAWIAHLGEEQKWDDALTHALAATQRFPLVARLWFDRAIVHAGRKETDEEMRSLQKALEISPGWGLASRQLSAAFDRTLQLDQSEHVLRRAIAADPNDSYNHGWLADVLWRRQQKPEAIAELERAVTLLPAYNWAWQRLDQWSRATGEPGRSVALVQRLTESRAGESQWLLRLVRQRFAAPDPTENLAALDRAEALDPRDVDLHDLRAQLLADHRRYDAALAACRPAVFGDTVPHALRGRAAWIEAQRGRRQEAIAGLTAVVREHPDYAWGWSRLTELHWEENDFDQVRTCAEKWSWLANDTAVPLGYLAAVHEKAHRIPDACAAFTRALAIDPLYDYGAHNLLRLLLDARDYPAAERVLQHFATHFPPGEHLKATLRYHLARQDREKATATLCDLARLDASAADTFAQGADLLLNASWTDPVENALAPILREEATLPAAGTYWARARRSQPFLATLFAARRRRPTPVHARAIALEVILWFTEKNRHRLLRAYIWWQRDLLRADLESWGQTGYALCTTGRWRATTRWLHDWSTRRPAPAPWMLVNLALAHFSHGEPDEACRVLDYALTLPPDHTREKIAGWRALEHALAGETAAAEKLLGAINPHDKNAYHTALLEFTRHLLSIQQAPAAERPAAAEKVRAALVQKAQENAGIAEDASLAQFYRRTLRYVARETGRPWLRVKSHLPIPKPPGTKPSRDSSSIPPGLIWVIVMIGLSVFRTCSSSLTPPN